MNSSLSHPGTPAPWHLSRRAFLANSVGSLGALALAQLAADARESSGDPLAPKKPHFPAKAKAVICLFQHGGPSQMDLFDPKPELTKRHGKPHPDKLETHFHTQTGNLLASPEALDVLDDRDEVDHDRTVGRDVLRCRIEAVR